MKTTSRDIHLAVIKARNLLGRIFRPPLLYCGRVLLNYPVGVIPCWSPSTQNLVQMSRLMMLHRNVHHRDVKMVITYILRLFQGEQGGTRAVLKMALEFGAGVMDPAWLEFPAQTKDFFQLAHM